MMVVVGQWTMGGIPWVELKPKCLSVLAAVFVF